MKTYNVDVSQNAKSDLQRIKLYIIASSGLKKSAERIIRDLANRLRDFQTLPHQGTLRDDIRSGLRLLPHKKAVIAFEINEPENRVMVLRLFYGGEDIEAVFVQRKDEKR